AQRRGDQQERARPHHRADPAHRRPSRRQLPRRRPDHLDPDRLDGLQPLGRRSDPEPSPAGRGADADLPARLVAAPHRGARHRRHRDHPGDAARRGLPHPRRPGGDHVRLPRRRAHQPQPGQDPPRQGRPAGLLRQPARQAPLGRPRRRRHGGERRIGKGRAVSGSEKPESPKPPTSPARKKRPAWWRRWLMRPFVWGSLLIVALLAGSLFFVQSRYARRQVAARLVAAISEKIGRQIQVGDLDFTFLPPAVELRDVVIPGQRPSDPVLARVPFVRVQATWRDLRQQVLRLEQVEAVRPEFNLQINPDGSTNLPRWKSDSTANGQQRLEVQIGRVLVQGGVFHLNELQVPMTVDAKAVWGRLTGKAERGGKGGDRLDAMVTAQEVVTALPGAHPYAVTLSAKASLEPSEGHLRITAGRLAGPDLRAQVDGVISWRDQARVALRTDAQGAIRLVNRMGFMTEPIDGPFDYHGRVDVQGSNVLYGGTLTAPRVAILHRVFEDAVVRYTGGKEGLKAEIVRAGYAGGHAEGKVTVGWVNQDKLGIPVGLDLAFNGLAIQPLIHDQFPGQAIPVVDGLAGTVRGTFRYRFEHASALAGEGQADLTIDAVERGTGLPIAGTAPVALRGGVLSSDDIHLTAPAQTLAVSGFVFDLNKTAGRLLYRLDSQDLGKVAPLLTQGAPANEPPPFWLPNAGQGTVSGDLAIDGAQYLTHLSLDLQNAVAPILSGSVADTARSSPSPARYRSPRRARRERPPR